MTEKEIITIYENVVAKKYGIEFTLPDYLIRRILIIISTSCIKEIWK
jgi:hypothetical protein